uniref:Uncharacterized protein n=1 Tax=Anguilla anguilla TaxID=7936 RepID=A0A0E9TNH0_ANGAN
MCLLSVKNMVSQDHEFSLYSLACMNLFKM